MKKLLSLGIIFLLLASTSSAFIPHAAQGSSNEEVLFFDDPESYGDLWTDKGGQGHNVDDGSYWLFENITLYFKFNVRVSGPCLRFIGPYGEAFHPCMYLVAEPGEVYDFGSIYFDEERDIGEWTIILEANLEESNEVVEVDRLRIWITGGRVWTDKSVYNVGESVIIYVSPTPAIGVSYWLIIHRPDGSQFRVNLLGQNTAVIQAGPQVGEYKVELWGQIEYPGAEPRVVAECHYEVKAESVKCIGTWGSPDSDWSTGVTTDGDSFYITGTETDEEDIIVLMKVNPDCKVEWVKGWRTGIQDDSGNFGMDIELKDDYLLVAGDDRLLKFTLDGNLVWSKRIIGGPGFREVGFEDLALSDDDIYIATHHSGLLKIKEINNDLVVDWVLERVGHSVEYYKGFIYAIGGEMGEPHLLVKLGEDGHIVWAKDLENWIYDIRVTDHGIYALRVSNMIFKFDHDGNLLWAKEITLDVPEWFHLTGLHIDDNIYLYGYKGKDENSKPYEFIAVIIILDKHGNFLKGYALNSWGTSKFSDAASGFGSDCILLAGFTWDEITEAVRIDGATQQVSITIQDVTPDITRLEYDLRFSNIPGEVIELTGSTSYAGESDILFVILRKQEGPKTAEVRVRGYIISDPEYVFRPGGDVWRFDIKITEVLSDPTGSLHVGDVVFVEVHLHKGAQLIGFPETGPEKGDYVEVYGRYWGELWAEKPDHYLKNKEIEQKAIRFIGTVRNEPTDPYDIEVEIDKVLQDPEGKLSTYAGNQVAHVSITDPSKCDVVWPLREGDRIEVYAKDYEYSENDVYDVYVWIYPRDNILDGYVKSTKKAIRFIGTVRNEPTDPYDIEVEIDKVLQDPEGKLSTYAGNQVAHVSITDPSKCDVVWPLREGDRIEVYAKDYEYSENDVYDVYVWIYPRDHILDGYIKALLVDLTIEDIKFSKLNPVEGEPITITATIKNSGSEDIHDCFNVVFYQCSYFNDFEPNERGAYAPIEIETVCELRSGESVDVSVLWCAAPTYNINEKPIKVVVDLPDRVPESDEENNYKFVNINVVDNSNFDPERDGYHFKNYGYTPSEIEFLKGIVKAYVNSALKAILVNLVIGEGHCYGMSATSILYYLNSIPKPVNKPTFHMMKEDEGVLSNINAYQARQAFQLLKRLIHGASTTVPEVYKYIKQRTDQDIPVILGFEVYNNSTGKFIESHAVVAFDTYDYSDNVKHVIIYDSNYPGMARVVRFDLSRNEIYYICGYDKTTGDIYYAKNPIAEEAIAYEEDEDAVKKLAKAIKDFLKSLIDYLKNNNLNLIIFNCPVNVTIVDQHGRVLSDGGINEIPNARVEIVGETKMFYIPSNLTYTVNVDAYDYGNFSLALLTANEEITTFSNISVNPNTEAVVHISPSSITMDIDHDGDGNTDKQLIPPVSDYSYSISGLTVTFDASSSYDPDGYIVSYEWDFGDGSTASGVTVTHTYSQPGTYTVTLTVTDNDGLIASIPEQVTVSPSPEESNPDKKAVKVVRRKGGGGRRIRTQTDNDGLIASIPEQVTVSPSPEESNPDKKAVKVDGLLTLLLSILLFMSLSLKQKSRQKKRVQS